MSKKPFGRLAFRAEGVMWNCYIARSDSMKDAILMGSIMLRVIEEDDHVKAQFIKCMRDAFEYTAKQVVGLTVEEWGEPTPAPAKDRTKPT